MKELYYKLEVVGESHLIITLDEAKIFIEEEMKGKTEEDEMEFTITPVWMTEEEFDNLPEAEF